MKMHHTFICVNIYNLCKYILKNFSTNMIPSFGSIIWIAIVVERLIDSGMDEVTKRKKHLEEWKLDQKTFSADWILKGIGSWMKTSKIK